MDSVVVVDQQAERLTPTATENNHRSAMAWVGWLAGIGLLTSFIFWANPRQVWATLVRASPGWLVVSVAIGEIGVLCGVVRLRLLARLSLRFVDAMEIMLWSVVGNYLSLVKGAAFGVRTVLLKARGVAASQTLAGISLEVLYDLVMACILAAGLWLAGRYRMALPKASWWWFLAVLVVGLVGFRLIRVVRSHVLAQFLDTLRAGVSQRTLIWGGLTTLMIFLTYSIALQCVARAVGFHVSGIICLLTVSLGTLVGFLSSLPGGLGISDLTSAYALSLSGIPVVSGFSITLLNRVLGIGMTFGSLVLLRMLRRLRRDI